MQFNQNSLTTVFEPDDYSNQLHLGLSFFSQIPFFSSIRIGMSDLVIFDHHYVQLFTGNTFQEVYCSVSERITSIVFLKLVHSILFVCADSTIV